MVKGSKGDLDLFQDIFLEALKRIHKFDPERGAITTFISQIIKHVRIRFRYTNNLIRMTSPQYAPTKALREKALVIERREVVLASFDQDVLEKQETVNQAEQLIKTLKIREQFIIRLWMKGVLYRDIGLRIEPLTGYVLSRQRVKQILEKALEKLRNA